MTVKQARKAVHADLEAEGALVKTEDHTLKIGNSQRSGVVVEPLPSTQWFVKIKPLAEPAIAAVEQRQTRSSTPSTGRPTYFHWMDNIRDWCISRQLWWGHRIPAWHCRAEGCGHITVAREDSDGVRRVWQRRLHQDEDVLDTWFSSGLWPLRPWAGRPRTASMDEFYPTSLMETGWDILFFWVARMMMFGIHFTSRSRSGPSTCTRWCSGRTARRCPRPRAT